MPDSGSSPIPTDSRKSVFAARLTSTLILWGIVMVGILLDLPWLFFLLIGSLAILALLETLRMLEVQKVRPLYVWTIVLSVVYLGTTFYHTQTEPLGTRASFAHWDILFLCVHFMGLFTLTLFKPLEGMPSLLRIMAAFFAFVYAVMLFAFLSRILYLPAESGVFYALYCVMVTKFTDMGAYLVGSLCGKHKMIPHISPGKTWEGFGGAILGAYAASLILYFGFRSHFALFSVADVMILPVLLGLGAVVGDLAESVVKRCAGAKDSGKMLPGIGGALDLTDSICFTAPLLYFYMIYVLPRAS